MDEFSFIDFITPASYQQPSLMKGLGDDAAVLRPSSSDLITAVDVFVEGVHFKRETMSPYHIGYRVLAANLSDLAAMGADPAFYMVGMAIPSSWKKQELTDIYEGMKELAEVYNMDLIGGDTVSGSQLTISITVMGYCPREKARFRHLAKEDDIVFITGTIGDSCAGLHILSNPGKYDYTSYFIERHRMPTPRVNFAKALRRIPRVALNDISDGIANEANEIADASKVSIYLQADMIPYAKGFDQFPKSLQHKWKYFGGEDFEIMGTVSEENWGMVQLAASETFTKVTEIGYVAKSKGVHGKVYLQKQGESMLLKKDGYTHLK